MIAQTFTLNLEDLARLSDEEIKKRDFFSKWETVTASLLDSGYEMLETYQSSYGLPNEVIIIKQDNINKNIQGDFLTTIDKHGVLYYRPSYMYKQHAGITQVMKSLFPVIRH